MAMTLKSSYPEQWKYALKGNLGLRHAFLSPFLKQTDWFECLLTAFFEY